MRTSSIQPPLRIFAAWFFGSGFIGATLLYFLQPLAGLFLLLATCTVLAMTVAPIAHIVMRSKGFPTGEIIRSLLVGLFICLFLLAFTGWFNFT